MPTVSDNWKKLALQTLWAATHTPGGLLVSNVAALLRKKGVVWTAHQGGRLNMVDWLENNFPVVCADPTNANRNWVVFLHPSLEAYAAQAAYDLLYGQAAPMGLAQLCARLEEEHGIDPQHVERAFAQKPDALVRNGDECSAAPNKRPVFPVPPAARARLNARAGNKALVHSTNAKPPALSSQQDKTTWKQTALTVLWTATQRPYHQVTVDDSPIRITGVMVSEVPGLLQSAGIAWTEHRSYPHQTPEHWVTSNFPVALPYAYFNGVGQVEFVQFLYDSLIDYAAARCYDVLKQNSVPLSHLVQHLGNNYGLAAEHVREALSTYANVFTMDDSNVCSLVADARLEVKIPPKFVNYLAKQIESFVNTAPGQRFPLNDLYSRIPATRYYGADPQAWLNHALKLNFLVDNGYITPNPNSLSAQQSKVIRGKMQDYMLKRPHVLFSADDLLTIAKRENLNIDAILSHKTPKQWLAEIRSNSELQRTKDGLYIYAPGDASKYPIPPMHTYPAYCANYDQFKDMCYANFGYFKDARTALGFSSSDASSPMWLHYFVYVLIQTFSGCGGELLISTTAEGDPLVAFPLQLKTPDGNEVYALLHQNPFDNQQPLTLLAVAYPGQNDANNGGHLLCERFGLSGAGASSSMVEQVKQDTRQLIELRDRLQAALPALQDSLMRGVPDAADAFLADLQAWSRGWSAISEATFHLGWNYNMPELSISALQDQLDEQTAERQAIQAAVSALDRFLQNLQDNLVSKLGAQLSPNITDQIIKDRKTAAQSQASTGACDELLQLISVYRQLLSLCCNTEYYDPMVGQKALDQAPLVPAHFSAAPFQLFALWGTKPCSPSELDAPEAALRTVRAQLELKEQMDGRFYSPEGPSHKALFEYLLEHFDDHTAVAFPPVCPFDPLEIALIQGDAEAIRANLDPDVDADAVLEHMSSELQSTALLPAAQRLLDVCGNANHTAERLLLLACIYCKKDMAPALSRLLALYRQEARAEEFTALASRNPSLLTIENLRYGLMLRADALDPTLPATLATDFDLLYDKATYDHLQQYADRLPGLSDVLDVVRVPITDAADEDPVIRCIVADDPKALRAVTEARPVAGYTDEALNALASAAADAEEWISGSSAYATASRLLQLVGNQHHLAESLLWRSLRETDATPLKTRVSTLLSLLSDEQRWAECVRLADLHANLAPLSPRAEAGVILARLQTDPLLAMGKIRAALGSTLSLSHSKPEALELIRRLAASPDPTLSDFYGRLETMCGFLSHELYRGLILLGTHFNEILAQPDQLSELGFGSDEQAHMSQLRRTSAFSKDMDALSIAQRVHSFIGVRDQVAETFAAFALPQSAAMELLHSIYLTTGDSEALLALMRQYPALQTTHAQEYFMLLYKHDHHAELLPLLMEAEGLSPDLLTIRELEHLKACGEVTGHFDALASVLAHAKPTLAAELMERLHRAGDTARRQTLLLSNFSDMLTKWNAANLKLVITCNGTLSDEELEALQQLALGEDNQTELAVFLHNHCGTGDLKELADELYESSLKREGTPKQRQQTLSRLQRLYPARADELALQFALANAAQQDATDIKQIAAAVAACLHNIELTPVLLQQLFLSLDAEVLLSDPILAELQEYVSSDTLRPSLLAYYHPLLLGRQTHLQFAKPANFLSLMYLHALRSDDMPEAFLADARTLCLLITQAHHNEAAMLSLYYIETKCERIHQADFALFSVLRLYGEDSGMPADIAELAADHWPSGQPSKLRLFQDMLLTTPVQQAEEYCLFCRYFTDPKAGAGAMALDLSTNRPLNVAEQELLLDNLYLSPTDAERWNICARHLLLQSDPVIDARLRLTACRMNTQPKFIHYDDRDADPWWRCLESCENTGRSELVMEALLAWSETGETQLRANRNRQTLIMCCRYVENSILQNADYLDRLQAACGSEDVRTLLRRFFLKIPTTTILNDDLRSSVFVLSLLTAAFNDTEFLSEFVELKRSLLLELHPNLCVGLLSHLLLRRRYSDAVALFQQLRPTLDRCTYGKFLAELTDKSVEEVEGWASEYRNSTLLRLMLPDCERPVPIKVQYIWAAECIRDGEHRDGLEVAKLLCQTFPHDRACSLLRFIMAKQQSVAGLREMHEALCALISAPPSPSRYNPDFRTPLDYGHLLAVVQQLLSEHLSPDNEAYVRTLTPASEFYRTNSASGDITERSGQVTQIQRTETFIRDMLQNLDDDEHQRRLDVLISWVTGNWTQVLEKAIKYPDQWGNALSCDLPFESSGFALSFLRLLNERPPEEWEDAFARVAKIPGKDREAQLKAINFCRVKLNKLRWRNNDPFLSSITKLPLEETALVAQTFHVLLTPEFLMSPARSKHYTGLAMGLIFRPGVQRPLQDYAFSAFSDHEDRKAFVMYHALAACINFLRVCILMTTESQINLTVQQYRCFWYVIALLSDDQKLKFPDLYDDIKRKPSYFTMSLVLLCSPRANEMLLMKNRLPEAGRDVVDAMLAVVNMQTDVERMNYALSHPTPSVRNNLLFILSRWTEKTKLITINKSIAEQCRKAYIEARTYEGFENISFYFLHIRFQLANYKNQIPPPPGLYEGIEEDDVSEHAAPRPDSRVPASDDAPLPESDDELPAESDDPQATALLLANAIEQANECMSLQMLSAQEQQQPIATLQTRRDAIDRISKENRAARAKASETLFLLSQLHPETIAPADCLLHYAMDTHLLEPGDSPQQNRLVLIAASVASQANEKLAAVFSTQVNTSMMRAVLHFEQSNLPDVLRDFHALRQSYQQLADMVVDEGAARDISTVYRVMDSLYQTYETTHLTDIKPLMNALSEARSKLSRIPYRRGWESLTTSLNSLLFSEYCKLDAQPQLNVRVLNVGPSQYTGMIFGEVENIGSADAHAITMQTSFNGLSRSMTYQLPLLPGGTKASFDFGFQASYSASELPYTISTTYHTAEGLKIIHPETTGVFELTDEDAPYVNVSDMPEQTIQNFTPTADGRDVASPDFFGRESEKRALRSLYDGNAFPTCRNAILYGIRRSGKSSLLNYLTAYLNNTRPDLVAICQNTQENTNLSGTMISKVISELYAKSHIDEETRDALLDKWHVKPEDGDIDPSILPDFYIELKKKLNGRGLVLILDEFDRMIEVLRAHNLDTAFYSVLSGMLTSATMAETVHFLFCGNKSLIKEKQHDQQSTQFFQRMGAGDILVGAMPKSDMVNMITQSYAKYEGLCFTQEALDLLWTMAGGMVWVSKNIARNALKFALEAQRLVVYPSDIFTATTAFATNDTNCKHFFEGCDEDDTSVLDAICSQTARAWQQVSRDRLMEITAGKLAPQTLDTSLQNLIQLELIAPNQQNSNFYGFCTDIFRLYFRHRTEHTSKFPRAKEQDMYVRLAIPVK